MPPGLVCSPFGVTLNLCPDPKPPPRLELAPTAALAGAAAVSGAAGFSIVVQAAGAGGAAATSPAPGKERAAVGEGIGFEERVANPAVAAGSRNGREFAGLEQASEIIAEVVVRPGFESRVELIDSAQDQ
mgnify:CR=1 FL=1